MNSKRLSIIIPTFQRAKNLNEVLHSLENSLESSDHGLVEIVVIDNHSTDETTEVVSAFQKKSLIQYRYEKRDENVGMDLNFLLALQQGEYGQFIWFWSDRYYCELKISDVLNVLTTTAVDILTFSSLFPLSFLMRGGGDQAPHLGTSKRLKVSDLYAQGYFKPRVRRVGSSVSDCIIKNDPELLPSSLLTQHAGTFLVPVLIVLLPFLKKTASVVIFDDHKKYFTKLDPTQSRHNWVAVSEAMCSLGEKFDFIGTESENANIYYIGLCYNYLHFQRKGTFTTAISKADIMKFSERNRQWFRLQTKIVDLLFRNNAAPDLIRFTILTFAKLEGLKERLILAKRIVFGSPEKVH